MNESNLPFIAVSTTADTSQESDNRRNVAASSQPVDLSPSAPRATGAAPPRILFVPPRKARTFQGKEHPQFDESVAPSDRVPVAGIEDHWLFRSILSQGGACLLIADHVSTARMAAGLFSACCAEKLKLGALHVDRDVSVFHVATSRMNAVDLKTLDSWNDPGAGTFSKNYANDRYAHMPISTPGFASRIRDDFDASFGGIANPLAKNARLVVLQAPIAELLRDVPSVHAFIDDIVGDLVSTSIALIMVGTVNPSHVPTGLFDSIFFVREYDGEIGSNSFSLSLHRSEYLTQRAFPPLVITHTADGGWTSEVFISDDPDIRHMAARCKAGEKLEVIGAPYGLAKGQVSKLLKPLRLRGLLKPVH